MKPRIAVITLGGDDLEHSLAFSRDGLGLPTQGMIGTPCSGDETHPAGALVLFELNKGVMLALYPRTELAKESKHPVGGTSSTAFSLGQLVQNREEVETVLQQAQAAGATVTEEPHERAWGMYSGYFKDLDGHLWEFVWTPHLLPE